MFLAAAKVGGIHANNTDPDLFIYDNLIMQTNIIYAAYENNVKRLLYLGSSCIYPKNAPQPMKEEHLLTGLLEPTNEPYAIAKIAGIKMCEAYNRQYDTRYRSVMPTNLYGPGDNYNLENSHVLPALIRKCHLAKLAARGDIEALRKDEALFGPIPGFVRKPLGLAVDSDPLVFADERGGEPLVEVWGTGKALREFLHVDDMADACLFVMDLPWNEYVDVCRPTSLSPDYNPPSFLNVGNGLEMSIAEAAMLVKEVVGWLV